MKKTTSPSLVKETIQPQKNHRIDTHSYRGWLNSDSFIKRSLACLGYQAMGTLIIYGGILFVALIIAIIFLI